ncbi:MAG: DUF4870 domain-containing protein [Acidimicrobiia bacterium]|nr:DUF4870 domain-containing protein [Acidimicrobiia bacterium]NNF63907.1 DUF4870 domain-containing protein [Acidimicrobiia bacterium]
MEELKSDSKIWAIAAHLVPLAGFALLGPLVVYLIKKDEDAFVRSHASEALNFQISVAIYAVISAILILLFVGILMLIGLAIFALVASILAAIQASNGERYRYPLTIRFVS